MDGIKASGKAFCVVQDLKEIAERNKGMTVHEFLKLRKKEKLEEIEAKQFGMSVEEFRKIIKKN